MVYQTKPGVNDADHLEKTVAIIPAKFSGFISRQFSRSIDGKWIDLVFWKDLPSAKKAAEGASGAKKSLFGYFQPTPTFLTNLIC